jgi:chaperone required for assembly of F1-ATPase
VSKAVKRFYAVASVSQDGYGVLLDARTLRTPAGNVFRAPNKALATAVAAEWQAQGVSIAPAAMPLTQLAFAALDVGAAARAERIAYVCKFAETDLCCHRAEAPAELVVRQSATWDPLVDWGVRALGVRLKVVAGVLPAAADAGALTALTAHAEGLDDFRLAALAHAAGLTGSALVAFALVRGEIDAEATFAAAALDELWSLEHWGEDEEARGKLAQLRRNIEAVAALVQVLST